MNRDTYIGRKFEKYLFDWQIETGKTKKEFAEEYVHVNPNVISRWINGTAHMTNENFASVCNVLNKTPEDFLPVDRTEQLKNFLQYQIQRAEILRSKHAEHFDEGVNAETWGYFTGYRDAMKYILKEVEEHDV